VRVVTAVEALAALAPLLLMSSANRLVRIP